jgi:hypothetical protein
MPVVAVQSWGGMAMQVSVVVTGTPPMVMT